MTIKNPTAFISYSWDDKEHQIWVLKLVDKLRKSGINADMDLLRTQMNTINLNQMMVQNIKDSDYIIIVLTEKYSEKADKYLGGVGFETLLTLPYIMKNRDKLILVSKYKSNLTASIPFHLDGFHVYDLANEVTFDEIYQQLVYKLHGKEYYKVSEVAPVPDLEPVVDVTIEDELPDVMIPNLKTYSDFEKTQFIRNGYEQVINRLRLILEKCKKSNTNFEFEIKTVNQFKSIIYVYLNGNKVNGLKIWCGTGMTSSYESLNICQGTYLNETSDNSYNYVYNCEVDNNNELKFKSLMFTFSSKEQNTWNDIADFLWENDILRYLR